MEGSVHRSPPVDPINEPDDTSTLRIKQPTRCIEYPSFILS